MSPAMSPFCCQPSLLWWGSRLRLSLCTDLKTSCSQTGSSATFCQHYIATSHETLNKLRTRDRAKNRSTRQKVETSVDSHCVHMLTEALVKYYQHFTYIQLNYLQSMAHGPNSHLLCCQVRPYSLIWTCFAGRLTGTHPALSWSCGPVDSTGNWPTAAKIRDQCCSMARACRHLLIYYESIHKVQK